jgi:putative FmdB family regulatory protein
MPTYEYLCKKCNKRFELVQKITDPAIQTCPTCRGTVERLISGGNGLIFKGHGFYITDYKNSRTPQNTSKPNKKEAVNDAKPDKKEAANDTKPEKKEAADGAKSDKKETGNDSKSDKKEAA